MSKSKIYVIIRNDDPCFYSDPKLERELLEFFERAGVPQVLAIIPEVVDDPHDDRPQATHPLHENTEVLQLLREYHSKGLIEIAQHGFTHQTNSHHPPQTYDYNANDCFPGRPQRWLPYKNKHPKGFSEFSDLMVEEQREKIVRGKTYIEKHFGFSPTSFIYPWNSLTKESLEILRDEGFRCAPVEDQDESVDDLLVLGCCAWDIQGALENVSRLVARNQSALLHVSYHSWLLSGDERQSLEKFVKVLAGHPNVQFITPAQLPQKIPQLGRFLSMRSEVKHLAQRVSQHFRVEHLEAGDYYRLRIFKLKAILFLPEKIGCGRMLLWGLMAAVLATMGFGTLWWQAQIVSWQFLLVGGLGAISATAAALLLYRSQQAQVIGVRSRMEEIAETLTLILKLSLVERIREIPGRVKTWWQRRRLMPQDKRSGVCVVAENPAWGGTEVHTHQLIKDLLEEGHRVEYLSGRDNYLESNTDSLRDQGLLIRELAASVYDQGPQGYKTWLRIFRQIKSDVLVLPAPHTAFGSFSFLRAARRCFSRIIYIQHAHPTPFPENGDSKEVLRRRIRMNVVHRTLAVCEAVRQSLIENWRCPPSRARVIYTGIDTARFYCSREDAVRSRQAAGIGTNETVFGMVTRLSPEKGIDIALQSFADFCRQNPRHPARLIIAGTGPEEQSLKSLTRELAIENRVQWLGFQSNPQDVYRLMDFLLVTSREEAFPMVLLEGLSNGVIPIAFDVGGVDEIIGPSGLGWIVPKGNLEALVAAMAAAAGMSYEQQSLCIRTARSYIKENFSAEKSYTAFTREFYAETSLLGHWWLKVRWASASWYEFFKLVYLNSPLESLRRSLLKYFYNKTRAPEDPTGKTICVIEESDNWGGAEAHTRMVIADFLGRGYTVEFVSGRMNRMPAPPGVKLVETKMSLFDDGPGVSRKWLEVLKSLKSRRLIFPTLDVQFARSLAFLNVLAIAFDQVVYIEHTLPPELPQQKLKQYFNGRFKGFGLWWHKERLIRKLRMKGASQVVAVSDAVRESFIREWGCPENKIATIRNGIDCQRFKPAETTRELIRAEFGIPLNAWVFGMVTRLSPEKGVDLALLAFSEFCAAIDGDAFLAIAGEGDEERSLKELADDLGIADKVVWLGFQKDPTRAYACMDSVLVSSRVEGLPLALLEGMSMGSIPIVFEVGGVPEVVREPSLGWLVPLEDVSAFSKAMVEVALLSEAERQQYRQRVRDYIEATYDQSKMFSAYADLVAG